MSKNYIFPKPFTLESGKELQDLNLCYHSYGELNEAGDNVIWVFHALSANSDVLEWWDGLFGLGKCYDPQRYFIICVNAIGSPYGSTKPRDLSFPQFTVRDLAKAYQELAKSLNINKIHSLIGASFGGFQAMEFAYSFEGTVSNLILLATSAKESAWGIASHEAQRLALQSDESFGTEHGGFAGMKAARSSAMLMYRTADTFIETQSDADEKTDNFKAASYIQYQGEKFVKRFNALSYFYLTKCLDSHDIGRGRGGVQKALSRLDIPALVIGISSDALVPTRFQKEIAEALPQGQYKEIDSKYGHDGFLVETEQIAEVIGRFYQNQDLRQFNNKWKVLKFGGKALANGAPLQQVLEIINQEQKSGPSAIVVSARGNSTDQLINIYEKALAGQDYSSDLEAFAKYQKEEASDIDSELEELSATLAALKLLRTTDSFAYDSVLSFGERISAKVVAQKLKAQGLNAKAYNANELIFTRLYNDEFEVDIAKSEAAIAKLFNEIKEDEIPVITGFIAGSEEGKTVTLGRNGSNYSATLLASCLKAIEVQNWTDVAGIYSANPKYVPTARNIEQLSYRQANELANFGTTVLHPKTIYPLIKSNIPLRIKSTLHPDEPGTLITKDGSSRGIKAVTTVEDVALVSIEGDGLLDNIGIDGRIFSALMRKNISVRLISQASSERGIGFVVNKHAAQETEWILQREFAEEIKLKHISSITINPNIAIVAIVGRHNYALEKAIHGLRRNKIWMHLISNSISGEHISLVVDRDKLKQAVNVVHNQVFGALKTLNVFAIGKGNVGGKLIDQILSTSSDLERNRNLQINLVGVADSKRLYFDPKGIGARWRDRLERSEEKSSLQAVLQHLKNSGLENIVIADNTTAQEISEGYLEIIKHGFDLVASNKKSNSGAWEAYQELRKELKRSGRLFFYETNVGAGLPIIDTLRQMHHSADRILRVRGVFSGSLSYIFNRFSAEEKPFSEILLDAQKNGFTEPDPREDLSGLDVARKLIILAREVGLSVSLEDVEVNSLIPPALAKIESFDDFIKERDQIDQYFAEVKSKLSEGEVLRYTGDLDVSSGKLVVGLCHAHSSTPLGSIKSADSLIEMYSESYGEQPIVVQGAGAGAAVTARGVYSDLLRIGAQI